MRAMSIGKKGDIGLFCAFTLSLIVFTGPAIVQAQSEGKIKVSTNRFIRGGQIIIQLVGLDILNDLRNGVRLDLAGEYCGARSKYLEKIEAEIRWQSASGPLDFEDKRVRFLVDDKEVSIDSEVSYSLNQVSVKSLLLRASIPLETLREITAGGRVEMRIGAFKFALKDDALTKIREFTDKAVAMREDEGKS
ncbi:MAG TPA: hypothetical protein VI479_17005 [Blastocatellia bacterium]